MEFESILAVSGMPGLYKLAATRSNGLIIEDFDSGKKTFISMRKHQFTPLESIGIYTYSDVVDVREVLRAIDSNRDIVPMTNAQPTEFHTFFRKVLPEYDESRVYLSDIKKLVKWYWFLKERGLLPAEETDTVSEEEE